MTDWIVVRGRSEVIGDVRAPGRRSALTKLQRVYGGSMHGTGGFYDSLIDSRLAGSITVWTSSEVNDPRLFTRRPAAPKTKVVDARIFEMLDNEVKR